MLLEAGAGAAGAAGVEAAADPEAGVEGGFAEDAAEADGFSALGYTIVRRIFLVTTGEAVSLSIPCRL